MVKDVKELRPELRQEALADLEILKEREIKPVESWPTSLRRTTPQGFDAREGNASCG